MPSPFPGMDPYLEGAQSMSVHTALSVEIARELAPRLPARYVSRTNERFVMTLPDDEGVGITTADMYPDAFVVQTAGAPAGVSGAPTAVAPAPLSVATVMPEAVRHVTVEIRDAARRRLVTAIEVLSPVNKRGDGRKEYRRKRQRLLLGTAHLLEIDLLRAGRRVPMQRPLPEYPYFVFLSRAEKRPSTDVWPVRLEDALPTVPVPLLPGDEDVPLDLQEALSTVYDTFRYALTIDYARPPEVPLRPEEAAWANQRLGGRTPGTP